MANLENTQVWCCIPCHSDALNVPVWIQRDPYGVELKPGTLLLRGCISKQQCDKTRDKVSEG